MYSFYALQPKHPTNSGGHRFIVTLASEVHCSLPVGHMTALYIIHALALHATNRFFYRVLSDCMVFYMTMLFFNDILNFNILL